MASHEHSSARRAPGRRWAQATRPSGPRATGRVSRSRLPYSGAHDVGTRVATRLDYQASSRAKSSTRSRGRKASSTLISSRGSTSTSRTRSSAIIGSFISAGSAGGDYVKAVTRVMCPRWLIAAPP